MKKKQTLSKTELQEMTGLDFSEQNSQVEESRKKSIDAALEDFSIENIKPLPLPSVAEQAQTEAVPSVTEETDEVLPTNVVEQQPSAPTGLLDIVLEKDNLQLEFSGMKTMRRDDGMYEMVESPHIIACRNLYINTKNASRFCLFNFPTDDYDIEIIHKEELRRYKAWYLYNKIRTYKLFSWWN